MDSKKTIKMILIISTISAIVTMVPMEQKANAATNTTTDVNTNTINCQSKKGSTNTAIFGTLKYAGGKCTGQNGGTIAAGGVKSNSGALGVHRTQGPNRNSHFGGFIKR